MLSIDREMRHNTVQLSDSLRRHMAYDVAATRTTLDSGDGTPPGSAASAVQNPNRTPVLMAPVPVQRMGQVSPARKGPDLHQHRPVLALPLHVVDRKERLS